MNRVRDTFKAIAVATGALLWWAAQSAFAAEDTDFMRKTLIVEGLATPTSLQFGPDGYLYIAQMDGRLLRLLPVRDRRGNYGVLEREVIDLVARIPNHDDDGQRSDVSGRLVTGILVAGTRENPVIYVSSSDPRIGAGPELGDIGLDTNSGMVSRLRPVPGSDAWDKVDLVRGLPRSEHNHSVNGMALSDDGNTLYLAVGGNTNAGRASAEFAFLNEYALSAAVLAIDLAALDNMPVLGAGPHKYVLDLPTLNDPTRPDASQGIDVGDPFGGNDGLNQARLTPGGPVTIYASGFRNPYDLLITESGLMLTIDNGGDPNWGGPVVTDDAGACRADLAQGPARDTLNEDGLHVVTAGYYAGHPNPIRGNPTGAGLLLGEKGETFLAPGSGTLPEDWPPVPPELADLRQCRYLEPGREDAALATWGGSTNGLTEYTAGNLSGKYRGQILSANLLGDIVSFTLDQGGGEVVMGRSGYFASEVAIAPLDIVAQPDNGPFPGTVWVAAIGDASITVFEPKDYE